MAEQHTPGEGSHGGEERPLPVRPCICLHPKGEHRRRMDECQVEGCPCPLWRPANNPAGAQDATLGCLFGNGGTP